VDQLFYFSKYALSIYGSIPYNVLAHNKFCDLFRCINEERNYVKNIEIAAEDLRLSVLKAKRHKPAHAISVDREKETIVLSIRGTFSVFDGITDIDASYTPLTVAGVSGHVHSGILKSGQSVLNSVRQALIDVR
jgi:hypothetical protein